MSDHDSQPPENAAYPQPENLTLEPQRTATSGTNIVMVMVFIIVALLVVLIGLNLSKRGSISSERDPEIAELEAALEARRSDLNRDRAAMGLSPIGGTTEPIEKVSARLKEDADTLVALAGSYEQMLIETKTELAKKSGELLNSEQLRQSLVVEGQRLNSQLQQALLAGGESDQLRSMVEKLNAQRDAMVTELESLRAKLASGASSGDLADMQRRLDEAQRAKEFFEKRNTELEAELSKLRLFANSEDELLPQAVALVRSLQKLENHPDSDLMQAYSDLGVELGANVLHKLIFATGSSELSAADRAVLERLVSEVPDGDMVLVVGYASETGNVDANRTLSSDRATAAAELFSGIKRPGQLVQAVYLGQTDRFSSRIPERNQICEIWRIRKK
jgi:outer membrane protein OmpA-like peptidoglycan-associated protein